MYYIYKSLTTNLSKLVHNVIEPLSSTSFDCHYKTGGRENISVIERYLNLGGSSQLCMLALTRCFVKE